MAKAIDQIKIRAQIVGAGLDVKTPYILSFYVRQTRNELSSFNFSVKVQGSDFSSTGESNVLFIVNGVKIYTGVILSLNVRPCFDDPSYSIIDASGTDIRKLLEHKYFTRRCTDSTAAWAMITGVSRQGLKSQKLAYRPRSTNGLGFFVSYDSLKNGGAENTSKVKNYLNQSSGTPKGGGNNPFNEEQPYATIIATPTE